MSMNETPVANRTHITFFGKRNVGKSSLLNAVTGQNLAVVSPIKGTTTDPVYKTMELLPLGPVVIIDTPGFDDEGDLGQMRVEKTKQVLRKTDIAVLVVDSTCGLDEGDKRLIEAFTKRNIPYIVAFNKCDLAVSDIISTNKNEICVKDEICVSAKDGTNIDLLKEKIAALKDDKPAKRLLGDLISSRDVVVLVIPIDSSAPKGRLILPQQQAIRDILDASAITIAVKETELGYTLQHVCKNPALVVTDSQIFKKVAQVVPKSIPLTSFSILMARYKGLLNTAYKGANTIDQLKDGDKILIAEGCTHHRQCEDIGSVKIPKWIRDYTGKELNIEHSTGTEFPDDLTSYSLIIHCGGCMLNEKEMQYRLKCAEEQNAPITNYGIAIAHMNGILKRSTEIFSDLS